VVFKKIFLLQIFVIMICEVCGFKSHFTYRIFRSVVHFHSSGFVVLASGQSWQNV
jgi:hypothetical protein